MRGSSRKRTVTSALVALCALTAAALGSTAAATALQADDTSPEGLIDRLAALEQELPLLPPEDVIIIEDETWAEFPGDFTGARFELDNLADRARELFIDADDVDGPEASAVSDAARAILIQREGYEALAAWEEHDLAFPLDAFDEIGVASGADEVYGLAQVGLSLLLDANARSLAAHELLRDSELADEAERQVFAAAYDEARDFEARTRPLIHRALSLQTTQVLRTIDRFGSSAPGVEARARTMTVVCIPREAYLAGDSVAFELPEELAALGQTPAIDCPDIDNGNELRLVGQ
ncbi:MAG: hypothetical protein KY461_05780 [Actinobacteria bacterium]|nr:hypothetical protein [Actinomycetota bacterium]